MEAIAGSMESIAGSMNYLGDSLRFVGLLWFAVQLVLYYTNNEVKKQPIPTAPITTPDPAPVPAAVALAK